MVQAIGAGFCQHWRGDASAEALLDAWRGPLGAAPEVLTSQIY